MCMVFATTFGGSHRRSPKVVTIAEGDAWVCTNFPDQVVLKNLTDLLLSLFLPSLPPKVVPDGYDSR